MKRVGNKSGQLVRSASRRNKSSVRFQFDVTVDQLIGAKPGATYYVKWTRGVKVAQTKHHTAPSNLSSAAPLPIQEKLSLLVTLYRDPNRKFDPKDSKISLISVSPKKQERTAAKIHFDLTTFAGVPHASSTKIFKLSDKFSIRATVESRFLKAGPSGPGSAGASSALSGVSARSSDDDLDDDFDDLALDDVPDPDTTPKSKQPASLSKQPASVSKQPPTSVSKQPPTSVSKQPTSVSKQPASVSKQPQTSSSSSVPLLVETPRSASSLSNHRPKPQSKKLPSTSTISSADSTQSRSTRSRPSPPPPANVPSPVNTEHVAQLASLRKENERLSIDLAKFKAERSSLTASHNTQLEQLRSQLTTRTQEKDSIEKEHIASASLIARLQQDRSNLESQRNTLRDELDSVKRERDNFSSKCKRLAAADEKCKQLSQEVDRLVLAAARPKDDSPSNSAALQVEKRMDALREEKENLDRKVKAHEAHAAKTKAAYQKLSTMYNTLREQHVALRREKEQEQASMSSRSLPPQDHDDLASKLEDARQEVRDAQASKDSLQSDYDHLLSQNDSMQDRLERTTRELDEVRRENDDLHAETQELKGQRDMAMQRALSKGKSSSSNSGSTRSIGKVEEELRLTKDKLERDHTRLTRRNEELESEIRDLRDDIEYEKLEKTKAREERDTFRESARALERRTSLAAKQNDAMQSMRRQLSTQQMRDQDRESMISSLRGQVETLNKELKEARKESSSVNSGGRDEIGEILQGLVSTKVALAQAEDEKLNLQFALKKLKKSEKAIQERLAAHASRLEVKLGQANEELERLRKSRGLENASEFNDLGSDVDY